jgi:Ca-activated chloride channel family protein
VLLPFTQRLRRMARLVSWSMSLLVVGLVLNVAPMARAADNATLVLVLDSSGSMKERVGGDRKIDLAKSALNAVVSKLPPGAQVGLRVYGATVFDRSDKRACTDSQLVVPIGSDNRPALKAAIDRYKPYGETPISYSLKQAAKDVGTTGQRTIVLVSDGEETCNADPCATAAAITKSGINLKIDVIGLRVTAKARSQLQCVADKGKGTYYDADNRQQIEESLDKLATRAFRPFQLTGTPIEGTLDKSSAPTVGPGQYVDQLPGDSSKIHYQLSRSIPGSTLHASVALVATRGGALLGFTMVMHDRAGAGCDSGGGFGAAYVGSNPVVSAEIDSGHPYGKSTCSTGTSVQLELSGNVDAHGKKFELVVTEEPPVVSVRSLPAVEPDSQWQSMKAAGAVRKAPVAGTNFVNAPVLQPGSYRTEVLTGENQVFAVDCDWGQRIQVEAVVAPRRGALARAVDAFNRMEMHVFGSLRGPYGDVAVRGQPPASASFLYDSRALRIADSTPTIRYLNRDDSGRKPGGLPGLQYVVLNLSRDSSGQFLIPYTLTVKRFGQAGEGKPEYVAVSPSPSPSPSPTPTPGATAEPTPAATAAPTDSGKSVPLGTVAGIAAATLVLGAAGAALALRRSRRSRRRA